MGTPHQEHFVPHNGVRCLSMTRMGATSVGPLTPILVWGSQGGSRLKSDPATRPEGDVEGATDYRSTNSAQSGISAYKCASPELKP